MAATSTRQHRYVLIIVTFYVSYFPDYKMLFKEYRSLKPLVVLLITYVFAIVVRTTARQSKELYI